MRNLFLILSFFLILSVHGQNSKKDHYSGGMLFYQPGFTIAHNVHQKIEGYSSAIGGILRFYFWDYFTCGIYGGSQHTQYNSFGSENSYMKLGYGGLFAGGTYKTGRFRLTASIYGGMGAIDNLHIELQSNQTLHDAFLYNYSVITFSPILSIDFALTSKISLTFQTLCLTTRTPDKSVFYNPTAQIGILFNR